MYIQNIRLVLCLCLYCTLCVTHIAQASSIKPLWVANYFSGQEVLSPNYEGIAFIDIEGESPTLQEVATVESHAKQVLASRFASIVQSRITEHLSDDNGDTSQSAYYQGIAESRLKIKVDNTVFWFDDDENVLWAKVTIPKNKVGSSIEDAPLLLLPTKISHVYGIIYRFEQNDVWIKLEDGRSLCFRTNETISIGDRVIVAYDGKNPKEVYSNNNKLEGCIVINPRI